MSDFLIEISIHYDFEEKEYQIGRLIGGSMGGAIGDPIGGSITLTPHQEQIS